MATAPPGRRRSIGPGASPEEAAAIVAALERFMRATAPRGGERRAMSVPIHGVRAAILEGVMREDPEPIVRDRLDKYLKAARL